MAAPLIAGAALWLCPFWTGPTPSVLPLLWGGSCLGLWLVCAARQTRPAPDALLTCLLASLGLMVLLRSSSAANALAANVCLLAIGLAAYLGRSLVAQGKAQSIAWGLLLAGLINSALALAQYAGWTAEPVGTAFGFMRQRNNMASLCTLAWAAVLYLCHQGQLSQRLAVLASAVLMAALAATTSRAGFLQLALVSMALLVVRPKRLALLCLASLASYAAAAWLLPQLIGSSDTVWLRLLGSTANLGDGLQLQDSRKQLWSNTWALVTQHPLEGVGWRGLAYALHMTDFGVSERFGTQADNAHNLPLQLAAELGLPFAALWLGGLVWYLAAKARRTWLARHDTRMANALLGWGVVVVISLHSLLEYPLWYAPFQIALGLALGLIASPASLEQRKSWIPAKVPALCGAALILFCMYAAFDYYRVSQLFLASDKPKTQSSWLFANQVRFAKLLTTPVTEANAKEMWALGQQVIHFSPEPRVFKVLIAAGGFLEATDTSIAAELAVLKRQLALIER